MSVDNIKSLMNIMRSYFQDTHDVDINSTNINIKEIFFTIMKRLSLDPEHNIKSDLEKTKLTLKIVKEIVKKELKSTTPSDEQELYPDRGAILSSLQSQTPKLTQNTDVSSMMNSIADSMKSSTESAPVVQSLSDSVTQIQEKTIDENEFKEQMKSLEMDRDKFSHSIKDMYPNQENSFIDTRNEDSKNIRNEQVRGVEPKDFYIKNEKMHAEKNTSQTQGGSTFSGISIANTREDTQIEDLNRRILIKKYILINSFSRNWTVDKYRYVYKVKFASDGNSTTVRVPYYANNETVPHTKTHTFSGALNVAGYYDDRNEPHPKWVPGDLGKLLGHEEYQIPPEQVATTMNHFNNIYSIAVTNITIPTERMHYSVNTIDTNISENYYDYNYTFHFPYIMCCIDEFQDIYDGTDSNIRKAFCQLQYKEFIKTPGGRGYIIFKPVQDEKKIFYPTCLSTLPTLNISLRKPNGELLDKSEDGISISHIAVDQTYYFKITTATYFIRDSFMKGDNIKIKDFTLYKLSDSGCILESDIQNLIAFINRDEGHIIHEIGDPSDDGYFNSFYMYAPGHFDREVGQFVVESKPKDTLTTFNAAIAEIAAIETLSTTYIHKYGNVINLSLQHSISMTVEMYKHDSSLINTVIVTKNVT